MSPEGMGANNQRPIMNEDVLEEMRKVIDWLKILKPQDRSEDARYYAVTITEMEKIIAYYETYLVKF